MSETDNDYEIPTQEELEGAVLDLEAQICDLNKRIEEAGVGSVSDGSAAPITVPDDFEQTVTEIRKRDKSSRTEALAKARHENPEGFEAYRVGDTNGDFDALVAAEIAKGSPAAVAAQRVGLRYPNAVAPGIAKKEKTPFEKVVDAIMEQEGCSRSVAMSIARKKEPAKFAHYQEA
jgi:hypothetical protein